MDEQIYKAIQTRDANQLSTLLAAEPNWPGYLDPTNPVMEGKDIGSVVGLCASYGWHDGLRVCRDAGLDPNLNCLVRQPLIWAYHHKDVISLDILLEMGMTPLSWAISQQFDGIKTDFFRAEDLHSLSSLGELDRQAIISHVHVKSPFALRPAFCNLALTRLHERSEVFFMRLAPLVADNEVCRHFAQFLYFTAWRQGNVGLALRLAADMHLEPNLDVVTLRLKLGEKARNESWVERALSMGMGGGVH